MNPILRTCYGGPSQRELDARARRNFLLNRNTRWHGQRGARR
ncbi:MAG TPA: hypothetical protein VFE72_04250 [Lysobacter sp.]|nr:hypothetical protein [Lysobacter sp.]